MCGCSSPNLALPRGLSSCDAYCIASKHHDRLPTLSISLSSYTHDMLWIPLIEAPGSGGLRPYITYFKLHTQPRGHCFQNSFWPEKSGGRGSPRSCRHLAFLLWLKLQIAIHHRLVECATLRRSSKTPSCKTALSEAATMSDMCLSSSICQPLSRHKIFNHNPESLSHLRQLQTNFTAQVMELMTHRSYATGSLRPRQISSPCRCSGSASS